MSYSASLIAYAFVKKGIEEGKFVTQMKLQKLVYIAHGYHLAKYAEPLVTEEFEAWKFGPVIPAIYQTYKLYGSSPISDTNIIELYNGKTDLSVLDFKAVDAISYTWASAGTLDAMQLSTWSHKEGSPWYNAYEPGIVSKPIDNESIKGYFSQELVSQ